MTLKRKRATDVLTIFLLFSTFSFAQKHTTILLETHLKKIEDFFKVSFNYESSLLKNKLCTDCFYNDKVSLKTHLEYLESQFMLSFTMVTQNKIVIKSLKKHTLYFYDSDDDTPLEHILITDLFKQKTWITDKEGKVFFEDELPKKILISHLSYGKQYIDISKLKTNKVSITKQTQGLETLIIYPFFSTGTFKKNDGTFFIKTKEVGTLAGLTSHDVIKNLENLPQVSSNSESISDLIVKGSTQDQNLFVWNNIKVYQNSHFFGLISAFNENLLSTITLYDNATPAKYGNSTSSVISLEHDKTPLKKITGGIGVNFLSADGYVKIPINKTSELLLSTRKSLTDVWDSPTYINYAKKAFQSSYIRTFDALNRSPVDTKKTFDFHDSQMKYKLAINKSNSIELNVLLLGNNLSYTEIDAHNISEESSLKQENTALGLDWQHTFSNNSQIEAVINYSKYKLDCGNFLLSRDISSFQSNSIRNYETALKYSSKPKTSGITYEAGISHEHLMTVNSINNFNQFFQSYIKQQSNIYGVFGTLNYYKNKVKAGLNLRNVYYEFLKSFQTEPRFHLTYNPLPEIDIQLRSEIKTQNISQVINLENNFLSIEKRRWHLANDSIAPLQKSKQIELAFGFKKRKHMLNTSIYAKTVKGITTNNQGFQNLNQFENLFGSYVIKGYTFHYNYKSRHLNTWLSYNYSINKYKFKDKNLNTSRFYNNNDMRHSLISGLNIKHKSLNFSLGMVYNSGKPYTSINKESPIIIDTFNRINYNEPNTERLSDYLRFDMSVSYNFDISQKIDYKLTLGLINIGNRKNILNRYYTLTEDKEDIETLNRYGLEFTPNISLNIDF
ncbi:TonB-dependent receptor plug domain-containing protein [Flavivirga jejuensis]|uniref:TonB-dependent receptor n=1 Tax=Flavivirga jejuensis TaxID=870487 RepID=A0ABT8WS49_9FLAO|nr:TonB-dependent receptor [Flavivirga jejuensis]MDO5976018.1 TonB-dependent receptor [Flavivirga jejuensis]